MDLYFYKGAKDVAATSAADLASLVAALADPTTATNSATIARVTGKIDSLVQSDSGEPLNLYFYDDATTVSSWATDSSVTLAVGLGDRDPLNAYDYASTTSFSISGNARTGTLALNTTALRTALQEAGVGLSSYPLRNPRPKSSVQLFLHVRKATAAGVTETVGLLAVTVEAGVLTSAPSDNDATTYVDTETFATGAVHPLTAITSLTGGGSAALDGIVTAANAKPTGYTVLLSYGRVGQTWQLIAGTDAEAPTAGVVRPDDYNASTNARIWVQL